jgi:hypothetical protein
MYLYYKPKNNITMKKLLLISLLSITASFAYAGSDCGKSCDKAGDKTEKTGLSEASTIIAGSDCGKKCDKKADKTDATNAAIKTELAGSSCGDGCGKKKDGEKSGLFLNDVSAA